MDIIVPCAGRSSRFPGMRPKYLLVDYSGQLMVERSIASIRKYGRIHIIILREHCYEYHAEQILRECFGDTVNIIILDAPTSSPAETIYKALDEIKPTGTFLIKDCDSYFDIEPVKGNAVYTSNLSDNPNLNNVSQLGYVISNQQNIVSALVEKRIVSDRFCVGGYQFENANDYRVAFLALKNRKGELYISQIIDYLVNRGEVFIDSEVKNYVNVGTLEAWREYNNKPTIFCDIDGVIVYNQGEYGPNSWESAIAIPIRTNVEKLYTLKENGAQIIFTTSRKEEYRKVTQEMLNRLGFEDCILIMGLHHARRVIINDYSNTNPYPSCVAININRDDERLKDLI